MGGTMLRLAEHQHEVYVAYQVSGSRAVKDEVLVRYLDFHDQMSGQVVSPDESEALAMKSRHPPAPRPAHAARVCQVDPARLHFLDLPFYERAPEGHRRITDEDIDVTVNLLRELKPHQIYAAGDLADPNGYPSPLPRNPGAGAAAESARRNGSPSARRGFIAAPGRNGQSTRSTWPCRSAPAEVACKRRAIFQHESQKNQDQGELGQRADDIARQTSRLFDALGLADYEAMETFHRWEA